MESNGLPISIRTSPANQHDSTKFIDVLENISDFLNDDLIHAIVSAYADKGYDAAYIRNYLRCYGINCCIPYKKNSKTVSVVHNLGILRVEVIIKIDSRRDKHVKMEDKLDSIKKQMN